MYILLKHIQSVLCEHQEVFVFFNVNMRETVYKEMSVGTVTYTYVTMAAIINSSKHFEMF